jgi:type I restriction enzyme S subunit
VREQRRIVDLMHAVDRLVASCNEVARRAALAQRALADVTILSSGAPEIQLGQIVDINIGRTPPRDNPAYWTSALTYPFCTIADMGLPSINPKREGITSAAIAAGKARLAPAGSLLMSFKLSIGKVGFASTDLYPNEAIAWFTAQKGVSVSLHYLRFALEAVDLLEGVARAVKGNTLNSKSLREIQVPLPAIDEQVRVAELLESASCLALKAETAATATASLRRSLLDELLSGNHELPASYDSLLQEAS